MSTDDGFGIRPDDLDRAGGSVPDSPGAADDGAAQRGTARPSNAGVRGAGAAGGAKPDRALTAVSVERIQAAIATVLSGLAGCECAVVVERIDFDPPGARAGRGDQLLTIRVSTTEAAGGSN